MGVLTFIEKQLFVYCLEYLTVIFLSFGVTEGIIAKTSHNN